MKPPHQPKKEVGIPIPPHTRTEREDAWLNVDECLRDIDQLTHGLPTGAMIDYAHNSLGQEVIDGLESWRSRPVSWPTKVRT